MRFFNHLVDGPEPGTIVSTAFNHPECIEEACSIKEEIARFVAGQREYTEAGDEAEERPGPKGDSDEVSHESDSDPARVAPSRAEILPPDLQSSPLQIQPESSRGRKGKSTSKAAITAEKLGPRLAAVASRSSTEVLDRIVNYLENSGISSEGLERALERSEARYERLDLRYERLEEKNHRLEGKHELLTQENSELKDANRELREKLAILTASGKNSPREGGGGDISDHAHNVPEHGLEGRQWF